MITHINAEILKNMFLAGAYNLEAKKEWINELNVFPVPDGDTGTNMTMTIMSAAKEVAALENPDMAALSKAVSSGSLRGARGNSGVILSQILRGITKILSDKTDVDVRVLAAACEKGCESAYKAVMKPKEGTILTVAKGICDRASGLAQEGIEDLDLFLQELIKAGNETLAKTPDMLPVLKQAGVVDSGGQGLMAVLEGMYDGFLGKEIDYSAIRVEAKSGKEFSGEVLETDNIKFGYCTEFIIMLNKPFSHKHEKDLKSYLESIGDSLVVVSDEELVKIHVHTNNPGMAIQRGLLYGQLSNMKIDNMRLEHQERIFKQDNSGTYKLIEDTPKEEDKPEPLKEFGFIAVSVGDGLTNIFKDLGVDFVITGGQTMNPSTEDFVEAIKKVNAKIIYILPNNKNIVLTANQAQYLVEGKELVVIPTTTIAQGITSILSFSGEADMETNREAMTLAAKAVKTGEVTYAVRDTNIDGHSISSGDYMGIGDGKILAVGKDLDETVMNLVDSMVDDDTELISIYYGSEIEKEQAQVLAELIEEKYGDCDVELQEGGQPVYYYIISAE